MIDTTSGYKTAILKNRILHHSVQIEFTDGNNVVVQDVGLFQFTVEDDTSNNNKFDIGSAIAKQLTFKLDNLDGSFNSKDFYQARIVAKVGLEVNGTTEWLYKGVFYAEPGTDTGDCISVMAYDKMTNFDKPYSSSNLSYPATLGAIVRDACSCCNVSMSADIASFHKSDFTVKTRPDGNVTFRQILQWAGQIACLNFKINPKEHLTAMWYDTALLETSASDLQSNNSVVKIRDLKNGSSFKTDDVVITAIKVVEKSPESDESTGEDIIYQSGTDGYVLSIEGNSLIQEGKGNEVANYLGSKLIGVRFRPLTAVCQSDPAVEAGDITLVTDRKGRQYKTMLTSVKYNAGGSMTVTSGAESPKRLSSTRYSEATKLYNEFRHNLNKQKTEWEKAMEDLKNSLAESKGLYPVTETLEDGSTVFYFCDHPTLEESKTVIKLNANGWGMSTDGGKNWNAGMTVDGAMITKILNTIGLNADWINTGALTVKDKNGDILFLADIANGRVDINPTTFALHGKTIEEIAQDGMKDYINDTVSEAVKDVSTQHFYGYDPTLTNAPTSEWDTDEKKAAHVNDLFYNTITKKMFRFVKSGNVYKWDPFIDPDIQTALDNASTAQDTADGKRRVFITTPVPPYDAGDMWLTSTVNGKGVVKVCKTSRDSDAYVSTDWIEPAYVDKDTLNTEIKAYDTSLGQTEVFNKLTNGGKSEGIYIEDGHLYVNASYILSGTLAGERVNAKNMTVKDSGGNTTFAVDAYGNVTIRANSFSLAGKGIGTIANEYANSALEDAKNYADTKDSTVLNNAKNYTLQQIAALPQSDGNNLIKGSKLTAQDIKDYWDTAGTLYYNSSDPEGGTRALILSGTTTDCFVSARRSTNQVVTTPGRYTLSIWLKASSARTIKLSINREFFDVSVTTSWKRYTFTRDVTSVGSSYQLFTIGGYSSINSGNTYIYDPVMQFGYTAEDIFNLITNNGQTQGLVMINGKLYLNGEYLQANTVSANAIKSNSITAEKLNVADLYSIAATIGGWKIGATSIYTDPTGNIGSVQLYGSSSISAYVRIRHKENGAYVNDMTMSYTGIGSNKSANALLLRPRPALATDSFSDGTHHNLGQTTFYGNVTVSADFTVTGTKKVRRSTEHYGEQDYYCYELPTPMLGDIGGGVISDDGTCMISIDDIFQESNNTVIEYYVFLQKEGAGDLWVSDKQPGFFMVSGTPGLKFAWELKAKQGGNGLGNIRFSEPSRNNDVGFSEMEYEQGYIDDMQATIEEMEDMKI